MNKFTEVDLKPTKKESTIKKFMLFLKSILYILKIVKVINDTE